MTTRDDETNKNGAPGEESAAEITTHDEDSTPAGYWPSIWRAKISAIPTFRIHGAYDTPATGRRLRRIEERAAAKAARRAKS